MSDLISRQDAIDALVNLTCYGIEEMRNLCEASVADSEGWLGGIRDAVDEIEALPSAEPERKWIPVSEALPWNDTNVLVTVLDDSGDTPWSYTSVGWCTPNGQYWVVDNEMCYGVIAWMPLPEPWRADR